jgi:hypothetical protein
MAEARRRAQAPSISRTARHEAPPSSPITPGAARILELQRQAGNAAVGELLEGLAPPALPAEMTEPYHPGDLSMRYWAMPAPERSEINTQTDSDFALRSGITRRLNRKNPRDLPAVRMWLRIRDEEIAKTVSAAVAPAAEAEAAVTEAPATEASATKSEAGAATTKPAAAPAPSLDMGEVSKLIAKHQTLKFLDEAGLAKDLLTHLPADPNYVMTVIKNLYWWHQRDATSVELGQLLGDDDLVSIASSPEGRDLLLLMVSEMQGVHTSAGDKKEAQRAMHAISKSRIASGPRVEIEVLTFRRGFAPLDWLGEHLFGKGAKGHTAVVAGGIAYSFDERGWIVAGTEQQYLEENTYRDAIGQVLDVSEEDAEKVQSALDDSVGTGTYLINKGSHVCTDEAARALEAALGKLDPKHNPQEFAKTLEASGKVSHTNNYPKKK